MTKKKLKSVKTASSSRRSFLKKASVSMAAVIAGTNVVFADKVPEGISLLGLDNEYQGLPGKDGRMILLNDRPINAETPPHLLDDDITPGERFFVRNNGLPPISVDKETWTLTIEGESAETSKVYSLKDLKSKFKEYTYQLTLECGGNGRKEFSPPAKGNQWGLGAVGCASWTGVGSTDRQSNARRKPHRLEYEWRRHPHLEWLSTKTSVWRMARLLLWQMARTDRNQK